MCVNDYTEQQDGNEDTPFCGRNENKLCAGTHSLPERLEHLKNVRRRQAWGKRSDDELVCHSQILLKERTSDTLQ